MIIKPSFETLRLLWCGSTPIWTSRSFLWISNIDLQSDSKTTFEGLDLAPLITGMKQLQIYQFKLFEERFLVVTLKGEGTKPFRSQKRSSKVFLKHVLHYNKMYFQWRVLVRTIFLDKKYHILTKFIFRRYLSKERCYVQNIFTIFSQQIIGG